MREQARLKKEVAWQTTLLERQHGEKYVPEPEVEAEVSDDFREEEAEDEEVVVGE